MVLSPQKTWETYNRTLLPLNVSIISSRDCGTYTIKQVYFNGEMTNAGCTRIYAKYLVPAEKTEKVIIVMLDPENDVYEQDFSVFLEKNWAVIAVDYAGNYMDKQRFTIYPAALNFANYNQNELLRVTETPLKTCWYIWTTVCLRAITFAESEGFTKTALLGIGVGGSHVFKAAAVTDYPICAATVFSPTFFPVSENPDVLAARVGVDINGYSSIIKVPVLQICCSNDSDSSLDKISDLNGQFSEKEAMRITPREKSDNAEKVLYIAPRVNRIFTSELKSNLEYFLSSFLDDDTVSTKADIEKKLSYLAPSIDFTVKGSDNRMYFNLKCESNLKSVTFYVSHGVSNSAYRNWREIPCEFVGENEYMAYTPVYASDSPVYCFVSVTSEAGFIYSTAVIKKIPSQLSIKPAPITKRRLIYDSDMGTDTFFSASETSVPFMKEGPFNISGVCSDNGLCTYKPGDVAFCGDSSSVLQIMLFSPVEQQITFFVTDNEQYNTYSCVKTVSPDTEWTKILLPASDFKSSKGALQSWDKVIFMRIEYNEQIIVSSLLWV